MRNWVYVLESVSNPQRHYAGVTSDPDERLAWHNADASKHTSKYGPWRLLVAIRFNDESRAREFELYLKSGSGRAFAKRHFT
jgi:putative endonuclease